MGRVSERQIDPSIQERLNEIFHDYFISLKSRLDVEEYLQSLLSPTEHKMLAKRLAIAVLISRGYNTEEVDQLLKVSKSTVNSVQRQMMSGASGYKKAVKHIQESSSREKLWLSIEQLLLSVSPNKAYQSSQWNMKSKAGKRIVKRKRQLSSL